MHAHRVVQRHRPERAVAVDQAVLDDLREARRAIGAMRAGHAFWLSGRAGGVEHQRRRLLVEVQRPRVLVALEQLRERRFADVNDPVLFGCDQASLRPRCSSRGRPVTLATRGERMWRPATVRPSRETRSRAGSGARPRGALPRVRPRSARAPARRAVRSSSSTKLRRTRPSTTASRSGCRAAAYSRLRARFTRFPPRPRLHRRSARNPCSDRDGRKACRRSLHGSAPRRGSRGGQPPP